ncbi:histidinol dehydrogenase [Oxobacter pfennigii]|nr:histidinol dehydrogenase [Oxobacter pfennigii]
MIRVLNGNEKDIINFLKSRQQNENEEIRKKVWDVLKGVKSKGDKAVFDYCKIFDHSEINDKNIMLTNEEISEAYDKVDADFIRIINAAKTNIEEFHKNQIQKPWFMTRSDGSILGQKVMPLDSVGIYVPGGTASYPSSVLMNSIPANLAGVRRIAMATPCKSGIINPYTIVAANECGVHEIYKIGGVHAVAAFAYGTDSVPKVDKIVGPGNIYVATAKKEVFGNVDIDMIAGPSEILIIADENANSKFIAADMMSQAEHDVLASSILLTTSQKLIDEVIIELERQCELLDRKDIILKSLDDYGAAIKVQSIEKAVELSNKIAPEHLEIMVKNPIELLDSIKNAGSIFLGDYSPEPLGDYFAGPNHVLPTGGSAAFFSPLSVDAFIKKSSFIYYSKSGLEKVSDDIQSFAAYEGLSAHGNSIKVRF